MLWVEMNVNLMVINDPEKCQRRPTKGGFCEFCAVVRPQVLRNLKWTRWQHRKYKSLGGLVFFFVRHFSQSTVTGAYQVHHIATHPSCGVQFVLQHLGCAELSVEAVLA